MLVLIFFIVKAFLIMTDEFVIFMFYIKNDPYSGVIFTCGVFWVILQGVPPLLCVSFVIFTSLKSLSVLTKKIGFVTYAMSQPPMRGSLW